MIDLIKKIFRRNGIDRSIYLSVLILAIFGIIMIGSASIGQTANEGSTYATMNMIKQIIYVLSGYVLMIVMTRCFKKSWITNTSTIVLFCIGIFLLLCCLPFEIKKVHAWIPLGPFTLQPSEFMKVFMICILSFHFGEIEELCEIPKFISKELKEKLKLKKFFYCIIRPILAVLATFVIIGFLQDDLGSALIFAFICVVLFFCTPKAYYTRWKIYALTFGGIVGVIAVVLLFTVLDPYQISRISTWLHPLGDPLIAGWQLSNALIAFSTGGLFGKGFGQSKQKYGYIAESHNDFIAAIIFEELGLVGFLLFLIPYCIIIFKMFNYGRLVKDTKSKLILYGIGTYFFTHLLVNVGGVSGFIPMTGVPLLLISYGGSSTWAAFLAIGIGQAIISKYNRDQLKEQL